MNPSDPHWEIVSVDDWAHEEFADEPLGTKDKFWATSPRGSRFLFKYARSGDDGITRGEDWAEWAVHHLAGLIGLPTALARPAIHDGRRGILSLSMVRRGEESLVHGNELLARADHGYDISRKRQNPGYTVEAVRKALIGVDVPGGLPGEIATGFDLWAGYCMLDAWVAARDRHHQNWAAIARGGSLILSPSFDHGNALGFQESEQRARLFSNDSVALRSWARKGASHHFDGKPSLVEVARQALNSASPGVGAVWRSSLAAYDDTSARAIIDAIPSPYLSDDGRTFRKRLLQLNRERILGGD